LSSNRPGERLSCVAWLRTKSLRCEILSAGHKILQDSGDHWEKFSPWHACGKYAQNLLAQRLALDSSTQNTANFGTQLTCNILKYTTTMGTHYRDYHFIEQCIEHAIEVMHCIDWLKIAAFVCEFHVPCDRLWQRPRDGVIIRLMCCTNRLTPSQHR
jgi:hypothetical protein